MKLAFAVVTLAVLGSATLLEDREMRQSRREFIAYGASQPRYTEVTGVTGVLAYDNDWDESLLQDEDGAVLNTRCAAVADLWTDYCHNAGNSKVRPRYFDYKASDGQCTYELAWQRNMCEQAECAYNYCHQQRDVYIGLCAANSAAYRDSLVDGVDQPLTLTNYFETQTFPSDANTKTVLNFISRRPGWNLLYRSAREGDCAEHY